ncbi:MAG: FKBP-type peptidyl-prolyl cis-trans isomerase SlpA [Candidatus Endobugula sp.]|jgi:FKBP-type peptidyl-prolyl cis-trans isomerase SlpA
MNMMSDVVISEGTMVTLHFSITLPTGEVIDSNFGEEAATFTVGDGNLLEGFEEAVMGLAAGSRETFTISPEKGFGQHNPSNMQTIKRDQFADDITLEKGLMLSFADAQNTELPGVVAEFTDKEVIVDFNHPLAGKAVLFEVQIISVEPTVQH